MQQDKTASHAGDEQPGNNRRVRPEELRVAVISDAETERNGVGAYYHDLIQQLRDRVAVIDTFSPSTHNKHRGLTLPLPGDSTQRIWFPPLLKIRREILALRPHVIIVPTPGPYGLLGWYLATRLGARLIVGFHTSYEKLTGLYWNRILGRITQSYFDMLNRMLFRDGEVVLANSQSMMAAARAAGARNVALMGTPLPRPFLTDPPGFPASPVRRIFYAGRLAAEKNLKLILEAAAELPDYEFCVAGDGPLRFEIERAAREMPNLDYIGWLDRDRMRAVVDSMDMLVLPSAIESFGTVALEAMARGRLVLVSAACGILDWPALNRGLFRINQGETLAQAIVRVAELDEAIRRKKSQLARQAAIELNEWSNRSWLATLSRETTP